jgi:hypothetical protein
VEASLVTFDRSKVTKSRACTIKAKIVGEEAKNRFANFLNASSLRRFLNAFSRPGVPSRLRREKTDVEQRHQA